MAKLVDNVVQEKYLWAGHNTALLAVYDGSDNLVARFEYGVGRMPVRMTQNSETYYFAYDQVGSLRAVFDDAGVLVHEITYDSYGNIITDETTSGFESVYIPPFGFAGGLHDRDTGMVLFGFRDYDPETGTWLTPDPIGFAGGDTYLYGYCGGDPVNWVDPSGLVHLYTGWQFTHRYVILDYDEDGKGKRYEFGPERVNVSIFKQLFGSITFNGTKGRVYETLDCVPGFFSKKFKIDVSKADQIVDYWEELSKSPPNYSLLTQHCWDPVLTTLFIAFPPITDPPVTMLDGIYRDNAFSLL